MPDLMAAKAAAVRSFLSTEQPEILALFAVSTAPKHNITGIGIGPKFVNGVPTSEDCVRLYVERKVPKSAIPSEFVLPSSIEGVPTDIIESGVFVADHPSLAPTLAATPSATGPITAKFRPVQPGCSCGFRFPPPNAGIVMAGTLGAIVEAAGQRFILSNNHVLANENSLPIGSPIFQPGLLDGGNPATDQVATLRKFVPISATSSNLVDCAIAQFADPQLANPVFLPNVGKLSSAVPVASALNMPVEKVGRTTGFTTGEVFDVSATVKVRYSFGIATFDNQVLVRGTAGPFSAPGDSGSLIVDVKTKRGTALLFAGSSAFTIGNKFDQVLSMLGVSLVI